MNILTQTGDLVTRGHITALTVQAIDRFHTSGRSDLPTHRLDASLVSCDRVTVWQGTEAECRRLVRHLAGAHLVAAGLLDLEDDERPTTLVSDTLAAIAASNEERYGYPKGAVA